MSNDKNIASAKLPYRADIDGLRALAVLGVVAYHYAPHGFPGGFIGVDIFFVISGYLITGILVKAFESHSFSLLNFYQRRIRRIFPALILILALCLGVGWFLFLPSEYRSLGKHVAAGAGFAENLILWREAGYFDAAAIQKPLLHLWSLAVEEQFYIFWPLALWVIMRRRWPVMASIVVIAGLSFGLNVWGIWTDHSTAAFYLPITRAWELMIGAWLAVGHRHNVPWLRCWVTGQSWLGLALIFAGFILIRPNAEFPGFWALLPALGSALLINAGPKAFPNRTFLSFRPTVWVGLISYPLYLWHWVLWSLIVVVTDTLLSHKQVLFVKMIALGLSFFLSWMTYRWLEQPIRRYGRAKTTFVLAIIVVLLGSGGAAVYELHGAPSRPVAVNASPYLASLKEDPRIRRCYTSNNDYTDAEHWSCQLGSLGSTTLVMAFGDSHISRLIPDLDRYGKAADVRVIVLGMSRCPHLLQTYRDMPTGKACMLLVKNAAALAKKLHPDAVVLAGHWVVYANDTKVFPTYSRSDGRSRADVTGAQAFKQGIEATLGYYQSLDIPVVLMEDNPGQLTRLPLAPLRFGAVGRINRGAISLAENRKNQGQVNHIMEMEAAKFPIASVLNIDKALCNSSVCPWAIGTEFLYKNSSHLSAAGAMRVYPLLAKRLNQVLANTP